MDLEVGSELASELPETQFLHLFESKLIQNIAAVLHNEKKQQEASTALNPVTNPLLWNINAIIAMSVLCWKGWDWPRNQY